MARAKAIMFTTEELRSLVNMAQENASSYYMRKIKSGAKDVDKDPLYNRYCEIADKAYHELTNRYYGGKSEED